MNLYKSFIKFFDIHVSWFFINGQKLKKHQQYINKKYNF